ncbi:MAG: hydrogenase large subunit [Acidimicrobiales bacterium]
MSSLEGTVGAVIEREAVRVADMFVRARGEVLVLYLVLAMDAQRCYMILDCDLEAATYPALEAIGAAVFVEKCEAFEKFGARPAGAAALNRVLVAPGREETFPRFDGNRVSDWESAVPGFDPASGEAIEFPFGPVRAAAWESLYMGLITVGEELLDVHLGYWHKHRAIERLLTGMAPETALAFVERTEGLSAVANTWAFSAAVEEAAGVVVPEQAASSRGVALELERLYNHIAATAALCQSTGLSVGQAQAEMLLEESLRCNLAVFGHRYLFGVTSIGGVARGPDVDALGAMLPGVVAGFQRLSESLLRTNSFVDRLEEAGVVTPERASALGLVGPVARASGADLDSRRDHPLPPWTWLVPRPVLMEEGDVRARMRVMCEETRESAGLVQQLARTAGRQGTSVAAAAGSGLGWAESSRGESLAWVSLDGSGLIQDVRLRPAAVRNWRAFGDALRSRNVFTDVAIIEASFWLTVAGAAR